MKEKMKREREREREVKRGEKEDVFFFTKKMFQDPRTRQMNQPKI